MVISLTKDAATLFDFDVNSPKNEMSNPPTSQLDDWTLDVIWQDENSIAVCLLHTHSLFCLMMMMTKNSDFGGCRQLLETQLVKFLDEFGLTKHEGYIFRQIETNLENNFHYNLEG